MFTVRSRCRRQKVRTTRPVDSLRQLHTAPTGPRTVPQGLLAPDQSLGWKVKEQSSPATSVSSIDRNLFHRTTAWFHVKRTCGRPSVRPALCGCREFSRIGHQRTGIKSGHLLMASSIGSETSRNYCGDARVDRCGGTSALKGTRAWAWSSWRRKAPTSDQTVQAGDFVKLFPHRGVRAGTGTRSRDQHSITSRNHSETLALVAVYAGFRPEIQHNVSRETRPTAGVAAATCAPLPRPTAARNGSAHCHRSSQTKNGHRPKAMAISKR